MQGVIECFPRNLRDGPCNLTLPPTPQFIMRFADLDLGCLARAFALLQLPRMGELRHIKTDFEAPP